MTRSVVDDLIDWFAFKSAPFERFLARNAEVSEWAVSADFCFDSKMPNATFAFTVIPVTRPVDEIMLDIGSRLPQDLKAVRDISPEAVQLLRDDRFFHFGFVVDNHHKDELDVVKSHVDRMVEFIRRSHASPDLIKNFDALGTRAKAKSFNKNLLVDMLLLCSFYAFIIFVLARDAKAQMVVLYPDRDRMTDWLDGLYADLIGHMVRHDLAARQVGVPVPKMRKAVQAPNSERKGTWFDAFVRLPDYIAGGLASMSWMGERESRDKRSVLRTKAFQNAQNMIFCQLDFAGPLMPSEFSFMRFDPLTAFT